MKIQIENQDRHGLVYDISRIMLKYHVNIISMEVIKNITYLELPALPLMKENAIVADIGRLPDITDIKQIAIMPRNKQYQQMKTVFDTISEGVIATDKSGLITYINRAAAKMLQLNNTDSIGGNIDTV